MRIVHIIPANPKNDECSHGSLQCLNSSVEPGKVVVYG